MGVGLHPTVVLRRYDGNSGTAVGKFLDIQYVLRGNPSFRENSLKRELIL